MKTTGLLWFDDDPRRPVVAKIAEAVERYRERIGVEPTICEVNPTQLPVMATASPKKRQRRSQSPSRPEIVLPRRLQLVPAENISPNYFMLGTDGDEALIPIWRRADVEVPAPRSRRPRLARATQPKAKETPAPKIKKVAKAKETPAPNVKAKTNEAPKAKVVAKKRSFGPAKVATKGAPNAKASVVANRAPERKAIGVAKEMAPTKVKGVTNEPHTSKVRILNKESTPVVAPVEPPAKKPAAHRVKRSA